MRKISDVKDRCSELYPVIPFFYQVKRGKND